MQFCRLFSGTGSCATHPVNALRAKCANYKDCMRNHSIKLAFGKEGLASQHGKSAKHALLRAQQSTLAVLSVCFRQTSAVSAQKCRRLFNINKMYDQASRQRFFHQTWQRFLSWFSKRMHKSRLKQHGWYIMGFILFNFAQEEKTFEE